MGIRHILDHLPEEVSGGQKQRTAIARALAKGTKYVFLDEPLANLDYKLREELRGELKLIFREKGGAIVYATPEPVDALGMANHVGFMHRGEIMQYGPVKEVYHHPNHVEVGKYFSYPTMNIFEAKIRNPRRENLFDGDGATPSGSDPYRRLTGARSVLPGDPCPCGGA